MMAGDVRSVINTKDIGQDLQLASKSREHRNEKPITVKVKTMLQKQDSMPQNATQLRQILGSASQRSTR